MNNFFLSNKERTINSKNLKMNSKKILLTFSLVLFISAVVISPQKYITTTLNGILVWGTAILPALFPFMIFTKLLTSTGYVEYISNSLSKVTKKLYNSPGISSYVFFMSILSGYPLGAKIISDLYEEGLVTRSEAHRICAFTSNSGPMFIVGTVGVGMFLSPFVGYILLFSHIIASLFNGLIYRKYSVEKNTVSVKKARIFKSINYNDIVNQSMENSIMSVLLIGGYITIFFVVIEVFSSLHIFYPITKLLSLIGVNETLTEGVIFGLFEITKGCLTIATTNISLGIKTILSSFVISFGGVSTAFQSFAFLNKFQVSKKFFFLQKTTHAILSAIVSLFIVWIFL